MIGVVDYKAGNLKSVDTALSFHGADFIISDDPEKLLKCDKMIFPGVGEALSAMEVLNKSGLGEAVKEFAASGKPLLGICLVRSLAHRTLLRDYGSPFPGVR